MSKRNKKTKPVEWKMNIHAASYVDASNIFKDQGNAWDLFFNGESDCSWGGNNRTLIDPQTIINCLDDCMECADDENTENEINEVKKRLESIPQGVYVDLES